MENIRIEKVGDINIDLPYLEVFLNNILFLEISISDKRELIFTFYPRETEYVLTVEEWEYIYTTAKEFLVGALKDFDYLAYLTSKGLL